MSLSKDPESLRKPEDSAHLGRHSFNQLAVKDTDATDEDGHLARTGTPTPQAVLLQCCLCSLPAWCREAARYRSGCAFRRTLRTSGISSHDIYSMEQPQAKRTFFEDSVLEYTSLTDIYTCMQAITLPLLRTL